MTPRDGGRGDRSIRNIPVPAGHRSVRKEVPVAPEQPMYEEDYSANERPRRRRGFIGSRFFWILVAVIVVCAVVGLLMSTLFAGASVTVSPRTATVTTPPTLQAQLNAPAGVLPYQAINATRTASTSIPASGTKQVSLQASGPMTIYNTTTASQDLVANTRFQAADGKIYRIHANVTVPKASGTTPGSVTTTVFADAPGAEYNRTTETQFTIPGFKGTSKFNTFSAKAPALSGGLVGTQPAVADKDLAAAQQALKQGLSDAMNQMVQTEVPKEFMVIPGTLTIAYDAIVQTPGPNGTAVLSQTANASASVLETRALASAIAKQTVEGYTGEALTFADTSQISIALATSSKTANTVTLALSGNPKLVWQFDPNALQQALIGKPKSQFETILKTFAPAITCSVETPCQASIRPFWSGTFPGSADKIEVKSEPK
jgi:hypothetical protein